MSACEHSVVTGVMQCLAAERRRAVLGHLLNSDTGQESFDALVDHVVEGGTHSPAADRESVAVTLYHRHLPKLANEGLIDYERERDSISTTDETALTEPYLEFVGNWEDEPDSRAKPEGT